MRAELGFDPARCAYGPASEAIQRILIEWASTDWFAPPSAGAEDSAASAFAEHHRRARVHMPELFPDDLAIRFMWGGWPEFVELCERVRTQYERWDWKYRVLKQLSRRHSEARGWSLGEAAVEMVPPGGPLPEDLIVRWPNGVTYWNASRPQLDLRGLQPSEAEAASWYLGFALMDLVECIEWQLAERNADLYGNPFWPLVCCHATGLEAFSLGPDEVVLFGFVAS